MPGLVPESNLQRRLVGTLYIEAMLLADEARSYFDDVGRSEREKLAPMTRVDFSCESLKVTTRLMHVIAWLLTHRAVEAGELRPTDALDPSRRLGEAPVSAAKCIAMLPPRAAALIEASADLHRRVARLDAAQADQHLPSPARNMQQFLERSLA
jgi:regulator of CtrA degradation